MSTFLHFKIYLYLHLQIPLLLSMQEEELALQKAVNSEDTDLIYLTLIHIDRSRTDLVIQFNSIQFNSISFLVLMHQTCLTFDMILQTIIDCNNLYFEMIAAYYLIFPYSRSLFFLCFLFICFPFLSCYLPVSILISLFSSLFSLYLFSPSIPFLSYSLHSSLLLSLFSLLFSPLSSLYSIFLLFRMPFIGLYILIQKLSIC